VIRRDGDRIAQPQLVEFVDRLAARGAICLVCHQDSGLVSAAQEIRHFLIPRIQAAAGIDHEDDDVSLADGHMGLVAGGHGDLGSRLGFHLTVVLQPSGVDKGELDAAPIGRAVDPVASGARLVLHDGPALADQAIEQRRFANVRPAYNSHNRFCHERSVKDTHQARRSPTPRHSPALCPQAWALASARV
jgi:hypothetical protein